MLKGVKLRSYVCEQAGSLLSSTLVDHLLSRTTNDLRYVHHQLDALQHWHQHTGKPVTAELIDMMVYPRGEVNNFALLDALCLDQAKALAAIDDSHDDGAHWVMYIG